MCTKRSEGKNRVDERQQKDQKTTMGTSRTTEVKSQPNSTTAGGEWVSLCIAKFKINKTEFIVYNNNNNNIT